MNIKDAVARALTLAQGQYISGTSLSRQLGVSRNAIWKAMQELRDAGYAIQANRKLGYCLTHAADLLNQETVQGALHTQVLGRNLVVLDSIDSTNDELRRRYRNGAGHGTVVAANAQTAGKGRRGHGFYSPPGTGLYFSVLLTDPISVQDAPLLTACAAVATAKAIDALYSTQVAIKWVNDLFLSGKKVCGILTEGALSVESGLMEYAILGIGINVCNPGDGLPPELAEIITSLEAEKPDVQPSRARLLAAVLYYLEQMLPHLQDRRFLAEYRSRSCLIGKVVQITLDSGETKKAAVLDIDDSCGLVIQDRFGNVETLKSAAAAVRLEARN